jgi:hypothetical protein
MKLSLKMQRNLLAASTLILLVVVGLLFGGVVGPGAAGPQGQANGKGNSKGVGKDPKSGKEVVLVEKDLQVDMSAIPAGTAVSGTGLLASGLTITKSGGNEIYKINAETYPAAYGANLNGVMNVINACSIPGGGIADLGAADLQGLARWETKNHAYEFDFEQPAQSFQIGVIDWGDFLPFGACPEGVCSMVMTAYNANGEVVGTTVKSFHATGDAINNRVTTEYGDMGKAGDACEAPEGQPGRFIIKVQGRSITRVTLGFANKESMDPNVALWLGPMEIQKDGCYNFLALSTDANKTFDFSGTADVQFCGGGVWSNNTGESSNNSVPGWDTSCAAPSFTSTNDWKKGSNLTDAGYALTSNTGTVLADPIAGTAPPVKPASCGAELTAGTVAVSGVTCFSSIKNGPNDGALIIEGDPSRNDNVLYIAGGVSIQGSFSATNVLIYTEGDFDMNSQSDSTLTPNLTGGLWHGFMLWTMGSQKTTVNGGSNSNWTGTIYSPNAPLLINGGSDAILRTTVIAKTIDFAGNNKTITYCDPSVNYVSIP